MAIRTTPYKRPARSSASAPASIFGGSGSSDSVFSNLGTSPFKKQSDAAVRAQMYKAYMDSHSGGDGDIGLFATFGNLLTDIKDTAVSLPAGLWETVTTDPRKTIERTVDQYEAYYSPLFSGNFGEFAENVQEHPLQFVLDVLPVAAVAGKAVQAGRIASGATATERTVMSGFRGNKIPVKQTLSLDPYKAGWQRAGSAVTKRVPIRAPLFGAERVQARNLMRDVERKERKLSGHNVQIERMVGALSNEEREAAAFVAQGLTKPEELRTYLAEKPRALMARELKDEEIARTEGLIRDYNTGGKTKARLEPVIDELREANRLTAEIDGLDPQAARWRELRPAVEVGKVKGAIPFVKAKRNAKGTLSVSYGGMKPKVKARAQASYRRLKPAQKRAYLKWADEAAANPNRFYHVTDDEGGQVTVRAYDPDGATDVTHTLPKPLVFNASNYRMRTDLIDGLGHAVKEQTGVDPTYLPHRPYELEEFGAIATGPTSMSLFKSGNWRPDIGLSLYDIQAGLKKQRIGTAGDFLADHAKTLPEGQALPKGWSKLSDKDARVALTSFRHAAEHGSDDLRKTADEMWAQITTKDRGDGDVMIVPDSLKERVQNMLDYREGGLLKTVNAFNNVWKAIILSLTPRFIGTNVAGNLFLYALNHPTFVPQIAKSYVQRMFIDNGINVGAETRTMYRHFPQRTKGLGVTERVGNIMHSQRKRNISKAVNIGYHIVGYTEEAQAEALMVKLAMKEPVIKDRVKKMYDAGERGTPDATLLSRAMDEVFELPEGAQVYDNISAEIDRVMGDYRNYSKFEHGVRALSPFYGWLRHIAKTTGTMAKDAPLGLTVMEAVGNQAPEHDPRLPEFMREYLGSVDSADPDSGIAQFLDLKPYNPWSTIADEISVLQAAVGGEAGNLPQGSTSIFGPIPSGIMEFMTGESLLTGAPAKNPSHLPGLFGVVANPLVQAGPIGIFREMADPEDLNYDTIPELYTPTGRVREQPERLIQRSPEASLFSWLGFTRRMVDTDVAEDMARQERGEKKRPKAKKTPKRRSVTLGY